MFCVFMCVINHALVDIENTASINEIGVEPTVKRKFLVIIELNAHITLYKHLSASDEEVIVGKPSNQFHRLFLLFPPAVVYMPVAYDLKIRKDATLRQIRDRDQSYLVNLLYHRVKFVFYVHVRHDLSPSLFHEVFKIIDVADLRRDCHAFLVRGANCAVEHESFVGSFAETREDKITAYHNACSAFSRFAVHCSDVFLSCVQKYVHVFAEGKHHIKRWRVVVIKSELL